MMTQEKSYPNSYPISTFLLEGFPVSPSQSPEQEKDLTIQEKRCFSRLLELLPLKNLLRGAMMIAKNVVATVSAMSAEQSLQEVRTSNAKNIQSPR